MISSESVFLVEPKEAIPRGSVAPGEPTVAPGEPSVAPRGARRAFSSYFAGIFEPVVGHFRPEKFSQFGRFGRSVEPEAKPTI